MDIYRRFASFLEEQYLKKCLLIQSIFKENKMNFSLKVVIFSMNLQNKLLSIKARQSESYEVNFIKVKSSFINNGEVMIPIIGNIEEHFYSLSERRNVCGMEASRITILNINKTINSGN